MFLRAYVELHLPIAKVEEALLRTPAEWIPGLASSAEEHGDQLLAEVGFLLAHFSLANAWRSSWAQRFAHLAALGCPSAGGPRGRAASSRRWKVSWRWRPSART